MAKKPNYAKDLLAETNPANLVNISIGSFLAFFVLLGSFITADAGMFVFTGKSTNLLAGPYSPGVDGGYGDMTGESGPQSPVSGQPWSETAGYNYGNNPDLNGDGKVDQEEYEDYFGNIDPTDDPINPPSGNGGGGYWPSEGGPDLEGQDASLGGDAGCLSATGCGQNGN